MQSFDDCMLDIAKRQEVTCVREVLSRTPGLHCLSVMSQAGTHATDACLARLHLVRCNACLWSFQYRVQPNRVSCSIMTTYRGC